MRRIYTKTGDRGTTRIFGGERVDKDDIRIEANGTIDELNAVIGIVRSLLSVDHEWQQLLQAIQSELMVMMSHVATPSTLRANNPNVLSTDLVPLCEKTMDDMMLELEDNGYFILPGGTQIAAQLQFARTVARRAERRLWTLHKHDELPDGILVLMNRLSDLFFIMARTELQKQEWPEERWKAFAYKSKAKK